MKILSIFVLDCSGVTKMSAHNDSLWSIRSIKHKHQAFLNERSTQVTLDCRANTIKPISIKHDNEYFYFKKSSDQNKILTFVCEKSIEAQGTINLIFGNIAAAEDVKDLTAIIKDPLRRVEKKDSYSKKTDEIASKYRYEYILTHTKLPPKKHETSSSFSLFNFSNNQTKTESNLNVESSKGFDR